MQPGTGLPVPARHQPLASQQLATWMVDRVSGGDPLEARLGHPVAVLDEGGDDPSQLFAVLSGDRIAEAGELIGRHFVRTDRDVHPVVRDLEVHAARARAG